jgi:signal transduction histidine kinase
VEVIFLKPEEKLPHIKGDAAKLRVVLQGLIENGIKYSNSGDKIFISSRVENNMMEISIKDTGIGISQEEQPLIFQKFFRAKNAQAVETIGTGFGLYTAKQVIEKHGGKIWFKSAEGEGTTFYFTVPLAKE